MRLLLAVAGLCMLAGGLFAWNLLRGYDDKAARAAVRLSVPAARVGELTPPDSSASSAEVAAGDLTWRAGAQVGNAEFEATEASSAATESTADSTVPAGEPGAQAESVLVRWAGEATKQAVLERLSAAREALKRDPEHPRALREELEALVELGRWSEAADTLAALATVEPENPRWLRERAGCLLRLAHFASALAPLREYLARAPQDAEAWSWLAAAQQSLGHLHDAEESWSRVLVLRPADAEALACRGELRLTLHDWSGAAADLQRACQLNPENTDAAIGLSAALAELGQHDAAFQRLSLVLERYPHHVRAINQLAELYWRSWMAGRAETHRSAAIDCWRRSLTLDPDQPQIRRLLEQALGVAP